MTHEHEEGLQKFIMREAITRMEQYWRSEGSMKRFKELADMQQDRRADTATAASDVASGSTQSQSSEIVASSSS